MLSDIIQMERLLAYIKEFVPIFVALIALGGTIATVILNSVNNSRNSKHQIFKEFLFKRMNAHQVICSEVITLYQNFAPYLKLGNKDRILETRDNFLAKYHKTVVNNFIWANDTFLSTVYLFTELISEFYKTFDVSVFANEQYRIDLWNRCEKITEKIIQAGQKYSCQNFLEREIKRYY